MTTEGAAPPAMMPALAEAVVDHVDFRLAGERRNSCDVATMLRAHARAPTGSSRIDLRGSSRTV